MLALDRYFGMHIFTNDMGGNPMLYVNLISTRRFDALKLWLTLRTTGEAPLGRAFDKVIGLARQTHIVLNDHPDFEVVNYPELSALVFRFAPDDLCSAL